MFLGFGMYAFSVGMCLLRFGLCVGGKGRKATLGK